LSSPLAKNVWNYTSLPPCVPAWCAQGQLLPLPSFKIYTYVIRDITDMWFKLQ